MNWASSVESLEQPKTSGLKIGQVRLQSVDAYRGFVMLLILAEVLRFSEVSEALPGSSFWAFLAFHQSHVPWAGCSLHDLIQPGFSFLVGVALPFSIANRQLRGEGIAQISKHAAFRSVVLIFLGIALVSADARRLDWRFTDALTQIGLAYPITFLLTLRPRRERWIALFVILGAYWLLFAVYPLPPAGFDFSTVGVSVEWLQKHGLQGFGAHWQKNSNPAAAFDRWFLNLFPRHTLFVGARNGLTTLNFVPLIGTMILGVWAGDLLRRELDGRRKVLWLVGAGSIGIIAGWLLHVFGVCPLVKAIWTPSWVLFSAGCCFLLMATWFMLVEVLDQKMLAFPLVVIGMNSILTYAMSHLYSAFAFGFWRRIFGSDIFRILGPAFEPLLYGVVVLGMFWMILWALYRKRIFLKV